jgi:hypothetical protein
MSHEETLQSALDSLRKRITTVMPAMIRDCLGMLDEEQVWWRPNEQSNSVGNIVLHVSGSLNHYLNRNIGGVPYERDRDAEFGERRPVSKGELLAIFDDMVAKAEETLGAVTIERFGEPSPEPRMSKLVIDEIIGIATHLSNHTGQVVWITKMLRGGEVDEVWIRAHKIHVWPRNAE